MSFFKNTVIIIALLTIHSTYAKKTGAKPALQPAAQPIKPQIIPPIQQPLQPIKPKIIKKSFKELVTQIKISPTSAVWYNTNQMLQPTFVNNLIEDARVAQLSRTQLDTLFIIARDTHAQFSGNTNNDLAILRNLETQRDNAISKL